jgi:signal transduction histidine kinase
LLDAEPITLIADRDQMTELVLILIDNAIRHTPAGGEIDVSIDQVGPNVHLTVRDTGEGIAPEHLPHVFERFYRAGAARDRASGGTGLGLSIAQSIARHHGGGISVESETGVGTAFTVSLPIESGIRRNSQVPSSSFS